MDNRQNRHISHNKQGSNEYLPQQAHQQYVGSKRSHRVVEATANSSTKMSFESGLESLASNYVTPKTQQPQQEQQINSGKRQKLVSSFSPGDASTNQISTPIRAGNRTSHTSQESDSHEKVSDNEEEEPQINTKRIVRVDPVDSSEVIDFSHYTRFMLNLPTGQAEPIFKTHKQNMLKIGDLMARDRQSSAHISRNKLSDKMGRRDVAFYDLYKKKEPIEDYHALKDRNFRHEDVLPENDAIYGDIECDDFNMVFSNEDMINEQFGESLKIKLVSKGGQVFRKVTEDESKCKKLSPEQMRIRERAGNIGKDNTPITREDRVDWQTIKLQLTGLMKEFNQSQDQIAELYTQLSGQMELMRSSLESQKNKDKHSWNKLEDLALACPEDSPEYQVLLQTKGQLAIWKRRKWLEATPITEAVTQTIGKIMEEPVQQENIAEAVEETDQQF